MSKDKKQDINARIKATCSQVGSAWPVVSKLAVDVIDHWENRASMGCNHVAYMAEQLYKADHKEIYSCFKKAVQKCIYAKFEETKNDDGVITSIKVTYNKEKWNAENEKAREAINTLKLQGLAAWKKPRAASTKKTTAVGVLEVTSKTLFAGLTELRSQGQAAKADELERVILASIKDSINLVSDALAVVAPKTAAAMVASYFKAVPSVETEESEVA